MDMTNAATKKQYSSTNVLNTIGNIFRPWLFCPIATPGRQGITETQKTSALQWLSGIYCLINYLRYMSMIRTARPADSESILKIYAPYIENTSYTFETDVPTIDSFKERITSYLQNWPWLICEIDGIIAGYAYGSKHRERVAYQWSIESSVYIHDDYQRMGVARALYTALISILRLQGFRNLYAVINLPNDKSVSFHENLGFEYFATYRNVGYKLGRWKNVGWWQLQLNEYSMEPRPPLKFPGVGTKEIENIFQTAERLLRLK